MCYPIFAINIIIGLGFLTNRKFMYSFKYVLYLTFSFLCVIAILHIAVTTKLNDANYLAFLGDCYKAKFTPGGLFIGLFTYPVTSLLNDAAGYVLFSIILVILIALIIDYLYAYKQFAKLNNTTSQENFKENLDEQEKPVSTVPTTQENIYFENSQNTNLEQEFSNQNEQEETHQEIQTQPSAQEIARRRLGLDKDFKNEVEKAPMTYEQKKAYILNENDESFNNRMFSSNKNSTTNWLNRDIEQKEQETVRPPKYISDEDNTIRPAFSNKKEEQSNRSREYINSLYKIEGENPHPIINADRVGDTKEITPKIQPIEKPTTFNSGIISSVEDFNKPKTYEQTNNFEQIKTSNNIQLQESNDTIENNKSNNLLIQSQQEEKPIEPIKPLNNEQPKKVSPLNPINLKSTPDIVELNKNQTGDIITSVEDFDKQSKDHDILSSLSTTFNLPSSFVKAKEESKKEKYEQTVMIGAEKPKKSIAPKYRKPSSYVRPPIDLLTTTSTNPDEYNEEHQKRIAILESKLEEFNIPAKVIAVRRGSAVTRYELQMPVGIAVKKIFAHSDDIAMALAANGDIRIEAPIRGKSAVGIEVPNATIDTVGLRDVIESPKFSNNPSPLVFALGKDVDGNLATCNLAKAPHLLVAGSTGSGKSVCLNSLIVSLLYKTSPEDLKFILVDPKRVEFGVFNYLPHMLIPKAIVEPKKALNAFDWLIMEMERRYVLFEENYVKNIEEYNSQPDVIKGTEDKLPYIVLIVDEFADLLLSANKKELEERVRKLTAKARAAGIHLILATQRPSVDVITGVIKLNLPTRIAFAVTNYQDSKTILDQGGAEKLLGKGDMLFSMQNAEPSRIQGAFVSTKEVVDVVNFIKENNESFFDEGIQENIENMEEESPQNVISSPSESTGNGYDALLPKALKYCIETNQASISMLQRRFSIGFSRSGRIIDQMEKSKFIGASDGGKARSVYITMEQFKEIFGDVEDE